MNKIKKVREELEIADGVRIGQQLWNHLRAHDFIGQTQFDFLYFMPDEVFVQVITDKSKYCKECNT